VTGASARPLLVATVLQSVVGAILVARGTVTLAPAPLAAALGVLAGIAAGYLLYRLVSLRAPAAREHASVRAIVAVAFVYVAISVAEEIIWRGWAFDTLASTRGTFVALIATTAAFAVVHGLHQGFAGVRLHLATGLAFGLTLLATRSLAAAAATHVTYNLAVLLGTVTTQKKARHDRLAIG
jgi:membrane protease YdiL (CAAX protease family)